MASPSERCKYPGCMKPRYLENIGGGHVRVHEFCGRTHADLHRRMTKFSAPPSLKKVWTAASTVLASTGGRQPLKATRDYQLHSGAGSVASGHTPVGIVRHTSTGLSRSNSLPRNYRPSRSFTSTLASSSYSSNEIRFYNRLDPYYEFTNFYYAPIMVDGKMWPTSEHYFQAQKFIGTPYVEKMRKFSAPREAFQYSRNPAVSRWQRSDWEDVKENVMLKALLCKFDQHENLRKMLLETRDKKLIEHTSNDSYWGDGGDGTGRNQLGELLMKIRSVLQEAYGAPPPSSRSKRKSPYRSSEAEDPAELEPEDRSALTSQPLLSSSRPRSSSCSNLANLTGTSTIHRQASPQLPLTGTSRLVFSEKEPDSTTFKLGTGSRVPPSNPTSGTKDGRGRSFVNSQQSKLPGSSKPGTISPGVPLSNLSSGEKDSHSPFSVSSQPSKLSRSSVERYQISHSCGKRQPQPSTARPRPLPAYLPPADSKPSTRPQTNNPITHCTWYS